MPRPRRAGAKTPARARVTLSLPDELARRVRAYAAFHQVDLGDLAEAALRPYIAGFRVTPGPGPGPVVEACAPPPEEGRGAA